MTLAARATRALEFAQLADPDQTARHVSEPTRRVRARLSRELASTLGVDPATVTATADPDRTYGAGNDPGPLLIVTDGDTVYRFVPELGTTGTVYLLGPCPGCGSDVPVANIAQLADLGQYLTTRQPAISPELRWDANHRPGCPHDATG